MAILKLNFADRTTLRANGITPLGSILELTGASLPMALQANAYRVPANLQTLSQTPSAISPLVFIMLAAATLSDAYGRTQIILTRPKLHFPRGRSHSSSCLQWQPKIKCPTSMERLSGSPTQTDRITPTNSVATKCAC